MAFTTFARSCYRTTRKTGQAGRAQSTAGRATFDGKGGYTYAQMTESSQCKVGAAGSSAMPNGANIRRPTMTAAGALNSNRIIYMPAATPRGRQQHRRASHEHVERVVACFCD